MRVRQLPDFDAAQLPVPAVAHRRTDGGSNGNNNCPGEQSSLHFHKKSPLKKSSRKSPAYLLCSHFVLSKAVGHVSEHWSSEETDNPLYAD
jgi:hypothetical protein